LGEVSDIQFSIQGEKPMFNTFNKPPEEQDDGWFAKQKAAIERYAEDVRLQQAGTSREQIAAEEKARAEQKAAEDRALLELMAKQKFDQLPEGQRGIYTKYASQMDEELAVERAKNEIQLTEDKLNRELETLGAQYETMFKNPSLYKNEIAQLDAQIQEKRTQLKQVLASKPYEPSQEYINQVSASSNKRR